MTPPTGPGLALLSSHELVTRAQDGDGGAREELARRYRPLLDRFAQTRLPPYARGRFDTQDLVQEAFIRALEHLSSFSGQRRGAFLAYLRQIVVNMVRDELRSAYHRRENVDVAEDLTDPRPGPLESVLDRETRESYERALASLRPDQQEAVVLRLELDCDYEEIARVTGRPSANAARMLVIRSLARLADAMSRPEDRSG